MMKHNFREDLENYFKTMYPEWRFNRLLASTLITDYVENRHLIEFEEPHDPLALKEAIDNLDPAHLGSEIECTNNGPNRALFCAQDYNEELSKIINKLIPYAIKDLSEPCREKSSATYLPHLNIEDEDREINQTPS